jgi:site-specific recombinase XerD
MSRIYQSSMALNLLCFIKRSKVNSSQKVPLYLRLSVNNDRAEISLKRFVDPSLWDSKRQQIKGRSEEAKITNEYINSMKLALYNHYNSFIAKGGELTASNLKASFFGKEERQKSVLEAFEYHNLRMKEQIGFGFAKGTFIRYSTTMAHLKGFLKWKYQTKDLPLNALNYQFITDLEFYFRKVRSCNHNTSLKYITNFKKVVTMARKLGWINHDPFIGYEVRFDLVDRDYLTQDEVYTIAEKHFSVERLNIVKDVFLFSCFTGLSYVDVEKLTVNNIVSGIDGNKWLSVERTKTGVSSKIPLLPIAEGILNKYRSNVHCLRSGKILPVISNQKVNAYLKEIADMCGIKKHLTFHVSRHTFATSITLANKVPIETVSKMLGHRSIKTTQIYGRVLDKKIGEDMNHLKEIFKVDKPDIQLGKIQNL